MTLQLQLNFQLLPANFTFLVTLLMSSLENQSQSINYYEFT